MEHISYVLSLNKCGSLSVHILTLARLARRQSFVFIYLCALLLYYILGQWIVRHVSRSGEEAELDASKEQINNTKVNNLD